MKEGREGKEGEEEKERRKERAEYQGDGEQKSFMRRHKALSTPAALTAETRGSPEGQELESSTERAKSRRNPAKQPGKQLLTHFSHATGRCSSSVLRGRRSPRTSPRALSSAEPRPAPPEGRAAAAAAAPPGGGQGRGGARGKGRFRPRRTGEVSLGIAGDLKSLGVPWEAGGRARLSRDSRRPRRAGNRPRGWALLGGGRQGALCWLQASEQGGRLGALGWVPTARLLKTCI